MRFSRITASYLYRPSAPALGAVFIVALWAVGCQPARRPAASAPATRPAVQPATMPGPAPATSSAPASQAASSPRPRLPRRPEPTWTAFGDAFDADADADIDSRWTGGKRLEIRTDNVQRMLIDFSKLPKQAPQRGPWNLQIDGQGFEITGRRGRRLELTRSDNGSWRITGPAPPQD